MSKPIRTIHTRFPIVVVSLITAIQLVTIIYHVIRIIRSTIDIRRRSRTGIVIVIRV